VDSDSDPSSDERGGEIPRPRSLSLIGAVGWTLTTVFIALLALDASAHFRPGLSADLVNSQICFALAFSITTFLVVRFHLPTRSLGDALGARPSHPALYVMALLAGALMQLPADWLGGVIERLSPRSDEELARLGEMFVFRGVWHKLIVAAVATAVGPFLEEVFCRGVLYRAMRFGASPRVVVVGTALCFALLHLSLYDMAPVFLCGLVLGGLRAMTGSMFVSLLGHMGFNGVVTFAILAGYTKMGDRGPSMPWTWGLGGAVGVVALLAGMAAISRRSEAVTTALAEDER
jgi:membrane protease YdiL (CAAX protease family)